MSKQTEKRKLEYIAIDALKEYERNTRTHSDEQVEQLKRSITAFGFTNPVLIDENNVIIAGHGRRSAARELGMREVPCLRLIGLTEAQKKALRIADNQLALNAGWDEEMLRLELADLKTENFDLDLIGFSLDELQQYLGEDEEQKEVVEDEAPAADNVKRRCKRGEIWQLGNHRLMCGDSTSADDVARLMDGEKADMVFTDPPYNVNYADKNKFLNAADKGNCNQREIINDNEATDEECAEKLWKPAFSNLQKHAKDCCSIYVTMPQGGAHMMMMMMCAASWKVKHELIWVKNNHVLGRVDYFYKHEPILYGWNKTHKFYGKGQFNKSVWEIPKPQQSDLHPTMKPIALIVNAILNSSKSDDIITDFFGGSGSTLIACEQTGRKCRMMEFEEHYCNVIIQRWENLTGKTAKKIK